MLELPQDTGLGKISMVEVFHGGDDPTLFVMKNRADHHYLAIWCSNDGDRSRNFFVVAISQKRLQSLREGRLDIRDAFRLPEDDIGEYLIVRSCGNSYTLTNACENIRHNMDIPSRDRIGNPVPLPAKGVRLPAKAE